MLRTTVIKMLERTAEALRKKTGTPKVWSRKGNCPSCNVSGGSRHNKFCTNVYAATKRNGHSN